MAVEAVLTQSRHGGLLTDSRLQTVDRHSPAAQRKLAVPDCARNVVRRDLRELRLGGCRIVGVGEPEGTCRMCSVMEVG